LVLALKNQWIWDFWLARDGHDWHIFFLKADKSLGDPFLRHQHATIGHAQSRNLIDWSHLGTCFSPGATASFDDCTTWTGSVMRGPDGTWHLFYTGTSHADNGLKQRIGHAIATDLHNWTRVGDGPALEISGPDYEEYSPGHWHDRAMRDPHVIHDPDGDGYLMFFTARVPGMAEPNAGGSIGFATSPDLYNWTLQPPVFRGGLFGQMEVPQVVRIGDRWYCMFCTSASHFARTYAQTYPGPLVGGTHYLMAPHPRGPWQIAPGQFFDGDTPTRRYAGKLVETPQGIQFMAFAHDGPDGEFIGEVSDPMDVTIDLNGRLRLGRGGSLPRTVREKPAW
jgi:beta-fructofuranosidase